MLFRLWTEAVSIQILLQLFCCSTVSRWGTSSWSTYTRYHQKKTQFHWQIKRLRTLKKKLKVIEGVSLFYIIQYSPNISFKVPVIKFIKIKPKQRTDDSSSLVCEIRQRVCGGCVVLPVCSVLFLTSLIGGSRRPFGLSKCLLT